MSTRSHFDPAADDVNAYSLLTALVVPRPIAWISTLSAAGVGNLAPHSFFTIVSADPPIVAFSSIGDKDTLRNVRETGEFAISLAPRAMLDDVNATSAKFHPETDEATAVGVTMQTSSAVGPPVVADSPASIECTLHSTIDLGTATLVLGTVVWMSVADSVLVDGRPSYEKLAVVSRLGGDEWGLPSGVLSVKRPARPEDIRR